MAPREVATTIQQQHPLRFHGDDGLDTASLVPGSQFLPYSLPWLDGLEEFIRRAGRWGTVNATCAVPLPAFPCMPFVQGEDEDGLDDDARTADQVRHRVQSFPFLLMSFGF